jgi:hypothetical protein
MPGGGCQAYKKINCHRIYKRSAGNPSSRGKGETSILGILTLRLRSDPPAAPFVIINVDSWRYRLGVRTEDSQSSNPGSIPGSATNLPKLLNPARFQACKVLVPNLSQKVEGCAQESEYYWVWHLLLFASGLHRRFKRSPVAGVRGAEGQRDPLGRGLEN